MKAYLTFDVEVWCNGWHDLGARFPAAFDRCCYGRSAAGGYALPKALEIISVRQVVQVCWPAAKNQLLCEFLPEQDFPLGDDWRYHLDLAVTPPQPAEAFPIDGRPFQHLEAAPDHVAQQLAGMELPPRADVLRTGARRDRADRGGRKARHHAVRPGLGRSSLSGAKPMNRC